MAYKKVYKKVLGYVIFLSPYIYLAWAFVGVKVSLFIISLVVLAIEIVELGLALIEDKPLRDLTLHKFVRNIFNKKERKHD